MTTTVCLFAGVGGTAYGAHEAGHEVVMVERDPIMCQTLRYNFPDSVVMEADVKEIDWDRFATGYGDVDVLEGGPPCQPFSQGGPQVGEYDPRDCIPDFIQAVIKLRPKVFVMENVWTLTWARYSEYLDRVLNDLRDAGYRVDYRVLRMDRYGVDQARKRLFIVGVRKDRADGPVWPAENPVTRSMAEFLGWDEAEAVSRAQMAPAYGYPKWVFDRPSTTVVGSFRPEVQAAPGYRGKGDPSRQNTPGSVVITLPEALALQGLPRDWYVHGNEAQQRLQVGNACPPQMMQQIVAANLK